MYQSYYGLNGKPFSIAPDPRFLYLSERHREALAHLVFGLGEGGGFVQLTGEVGTGKTTLSRALLEQVPDHVDVAMVLNPRVNAVELVATLCDELKVAYPDATTSLKTLTDALNHHLLASHVAGRKTVLVIDEAQNLSQDVLEQLRLLTNLETADEKLLQIILIGQPELKTLLGRNDLRQLAQRITARYHLEALARPETHAYIRHRLRVCGGSIDLFTRGAMDEIQRLSGGIPRLVNILCDRALLGGYVEEARRIDARIVRRAAREVLPDLRDQQGAGFRRHRVAALAVLAVLGLGAGAWFGPLSGQWPPGPVLFTATEGPAAGNVIGDPATGSGDEPVAAAAEAMAASSVSAAAAPAVETTAITAEPVVAADRLAEHLERSAQAGETAAWGALFQRWGRDYGASARPACEQAEANGLQCLNRTGNWNQLRQLNRPAILYLRDARARRVPMLLTQIQGEEGILDTGSSRVRLPLQVIDRHWYGDYVILWSSPVGAGLLRPGDAGRAVLWLRHQLAREGMLAGQPVDDARFDAGLQEAVRRFQASQGLAQDGIVGTLTFIQLNNADPDNPAPRLRPPAETG